MAHGRPIAVETIYRALHSPRRVIARDASAVLRTDRPHRRPRRRGDTRRPRFLVPITPIDQRPAEVLERVEPGHWEGDCIVGAFNRSAIGTLVERTFRYTILLHLDGESRAGAVRDQLIATFGALPPSLRKSLTWDQGSEMSHHHTVAEAVRMPVFFCDPGSPWQRPSNENTNGLLRGCSLPGQTGHLARCIPHLRRHLIRTAKRATASPGSSGEAVARFRLPRSLLTDHACATSRKSGRSQTDGPECLLHTVLEFLHHVLINAPEPSPRQPRRSRRGAPLRRGSAASPATSASPGRSRARHPWAGRSS